MTLGMLLATTAILTGLALGEPTGGAAVLLEQPAVVSAPLAFLTMIGVSLLDPRQIDAGADMLALHVPEGLGLRLADEDLEPASALP